jgi:type IV pilus assembly protein PilC
MPKFNYVAMDGNGKERKGNINAETDNEAVAKLKEQGLFPTSITEAKDDGGGKKGKKGAKSRKKKGSALNIQLGTPQMRPKQLMVFTRQLATLLDAGLPLVRGLRTLERQATDPGVETVLCDVADAVEGGQTFSEALAGHPKSFTKLYVNMVKAGEASGAMEQVLNKLAQFMEKAAKLKSKVKAALTYPIAVLTIALTITAGLMIFIVPKFAKIFDEMLAGEPLPGLTEFVMMLSDFLKTKAHFGIVGMIVFGICFKMFKKTKVGGRLIDLVAIKMPPFGGLVTKVSVARFCSTLGTLMSSGVSVLNALQIVRDTATNSVVADAVQVVHDAVKEGEGMSKPLESTGVFPGMVVSMIEVGEETGALPEMLGRIAVNYEEEVDQAVEALTSLIEPVMIIFLAVVIGGIVIALFLPLIKLIDTLGG